MHSAVLRSPSNHHKDPTDREGFLLRENKRYQVNLPNTKPRPKYLEQRLAHTKCSRHAGYYYSNSICFPSLLGGSVGYQKKIRFLGLTSLPNAHHTCSLSPKRDGSFRTGPGELLR